MAADFFIIFQLWQNTVCQLFTQLHAPLVEGEDVQDHALSKDFVLIQRNQRPQVERSDFTQQDGVGRAVTFEHFERHHVVKRCRIFTLIAIFLLNHFAGFTKRQRFSLSKEVRQQFLVVIRERVMGDSRSDEIARYHFGSLVDQLVERVLTVSAWFTPDNRASLVIHNVTVTVNILTVGLHIALLEVRRETVHILVIRQNRLSFRTKEIVVPDANQRQQYRQVFLGRRGGEMLVHRVCARKQFNEVIKADGENNRQANR